MGFRQGYEGGQWHANLFGSFFKYILIPVAGGFLISILLEVMFATVGVHKLPLFQKLEVWGGWIAGFYFLFLMAGGGSKKAAVAQASVTSRTGLKVKEGIYNLPTLERDIRTIKITNPYRHTLVAGGPGSGKSFSILEPMLVQAMQQGKAALVYDYKFPTFARLVATYKVQGVTPYYINFDDLTRSHRVNPIDPQLMNRSSFADQYARTVVYNLIPDAATSANPFFADSAQGYLGGPPTFVRNVPSELFWVSLQELIQF